MNLLKIYTVLDPVLRTKTTPIFSSNQPKVDNKILGENIANMFHTMEHAEGIGLAANQVGLPYRLVVLDVPAEHDGGAILKNIQGSELQKKSLMEAMDVASWQDAQTPNKDRILKEKGINPMPLGAVKGEMIDPKIIWASHRYVKGKEGCLSVPEFVADVLRHHEIIVDFFSVEREKKYLYLRGLAAICVQHELDHLNGIAFIDYLDQSKQKAAMKLLESRVNIGSV